MKPKFLKESMKFVLERCWSYTILYFPIAHNAFCLPPKFCINYCFQIILGRLYIPKTIVYAKFGGHTKCIMGNWKIENREFSCSKMTEKIMVRTGPTPGVHLLEVSINSETTVYLTHIHKNFMSVLVKVY